MKDHKPDCPQIDCKCPQKEGVSVIRIENRFIPEGSELVEAYETEKEIIVCGNPEDEPDATALTDEEMDAWYETAHNCDAMGCGSLSHVLYRFNKEIPSVSNALPEERNAGGGGHTPTPYRIYKDHSGSISIVSDTPSRVLQQWALENPGKQGFDRYSSEIAQVHPRYNGSGKQFGPHELIDDDELEANAAFIVEACNSYKSLQAQNQALVGACQRLIEVENRIQSNFPTEYMDAVREALAPFQTKGGAE